MKYSYSVSMTTEMNIKQQNYVGQFVIILKPLFPLNKKPAGHCSTGWQFDMAMFH